MTLDYGFTGNPDDLLVVTDAQLDFTYGVLGTIQAISCLNGMKHLIRNFKGKVVWTKDTHKDDYLDTQEGKLLPVPHTIRGTKGWRIDPYLASLIHEGMNVLERDVFEKDVFGSIGLLEYIKANHFKRVFFIGFCTGICVISNAVIARTADPEIEVHIIGNLCACVNDRTHAVAVEAMKTLQCYIDEMNLPATEYEFKTVNGMTRVVAAHGSDIIANEEARQIAEQDGIRFIHVTELPIDMPVGMKHGCWLDTYANREALRKYA